MSEDDRRIIAMKWIVEAVTLIFVCALVALTAIVQPGSILASGVQISSAVALLALTTVSAFTGFKVNFIPSRICPVLFTPSAQLNLLAVLSHRPRQRHR
jgi:hypothetical protein